MIGSPPVKISGQSLRQDGRESMETGDCLRNWELKALLRGMGNLTAFFRLLQKLSDRHILYRVIYESPDEPLCYERLSSFGMVLLPDAFAMRQEDIKITQKLPERWGTSDYSGARA